MNRILTIFSCFFILSCSQLIADLALKEILVLPMSEKEVTEWRAVRNTLTDKGGGVSYYPTCELDWRCSKRLEISYIHRSSFETWATESIQVLADHIAHTASKTVGSELVQTIFAINENDALIGCRCPKSNEYVLYRIYLTQDWCQMICLSMVDEVWQNEKTRQIELIKGAKLVPLQDPLVNSGLSIVPMKEVPQAMRGFFPNFSCDHFAADGADGQSYIFLPKEPVEDSPEVLTFILSSMGPLSLQCVIDVHKLGLEQGLGMKLPFKTHSQSKSQALIAAPTKGGIVIFKVFALQEGFAILVLEKDSKTPISRKEMDGWLKRFKAVQLPNDW